MDKKLKTKKFANDLLHLIMGRNVYYWVEKISRWNLVKLKFPSDFPYATFIHTKEAACAIKIIQYDKVYTKSKHGPNFTKVNNNKKNSLLAGLGELIC